MDYIVLGSNFALLVKSPGDDGQQQLTTVSRYVYRCRKHFVPVWCICVNLITVSQNQLLPWTCVFNIYFGSSDRGNFGVTMTFLWITFWESFSKVETSPLPNISAEFGNTLFPASLVSHEPFNTTLEKTLFFTSTLFAKISLPQKKNSLFGGLALTHILTYLVLTTWTWSPNPVFLPYILL